MSVGMRAYSLGVAWRDRLFVTDTTVGIPFVIRVPTDSTNSTYNVYSSNSPRRLEVIYATGTMTGAGAAADTVVINNGSNAITDTLDVSSLADTDVFDFTKISDTYYRVNKGGSLSVVTASAALCVVYIHCMWV